MNIRYTLPLVILGVFMVFAWIGLSLNPREVPTPFIGKQAPAFKLSQLHDYNLSLSPEDNLGKVWLLNVWASWCVACRQEHPILMQMAKRGDIILYGLNYKDTPDAAKSWLEQHGNPYLASAFDMDGRVGIDYGVYGVPETFVIDKKGIIREKVIGPIGYKKLQDELLPLLQQLAMEEYQG